MRARVLLAIVATVVVVGVAVTVGVRLSVVQRTTQGHALTRRAQAPPAIRSTPATTPTATPTATPTPVPPPPAAYQLPVPYTEQAVNGIWNANNEHWCTAAATVMLQHYYSGDREAVIPAAAANQEMAQVIAQDRAAYPGVLELPLPDVEHTAGVVYGMTGTIEQMNFAAMEAAVAAGHPVILAVMTHGLPGGAAIAPYYGPINTHHVILIIGYDAANQTVLTNDPGFSQGRAYTYSWATLQVASAAEGAIYDPAGTMLVLTPGA